jgi:hypothetical protein
MLWILLTVAAAPLQVARNAMQRGLVGDAGPWGATLVRFLFGLPFSLLIFAAVALATPGAAAHPSARFWIGVSLGALAQVGATAALLAAMHRSGFAVATFMQQSSLPRRSACRSSPGPGPARGGARWPARAWAWRRGRPSPWR